jgi:hypothetical protein
MTTKLLDARWTNTIEFPEKGTLRLILGGIALSIAIISLNTIISATSPVTAFPYDDMFLIEGVWRIVQGQREGADFYNPIGFGVFHVGAAWWRILGAHRDVLPLTSATFSAFIMLCASIICARRIWFSVPYYLLICGVLAFEMSAPSVYGWSFFSIGSAAFYNRLTTAALAVLFIQWFGVKRSIDGRQTLSELVISATLLNILFLVKISALVIAPIILGLSLSVERKPVNIFARSLGILSIALIIMFIGDFIITGAHVGAIVDDYREAAAVRTDLVSWDGFSRVLKSGSTILSALLLIMYARKPPAVSQSKSITAIASYVVVQLVLNMSNTQPATIYLAPACAVVLLSWRKRSVMNQPIPQQGSAGAGTKSPAPWIPIAVCLIVLVPQVLSSAVGAALVGAITFGLKTPTVISSGNGLNLPVLGGFGDGDRALDFAVSVKRGIEALRDLKLTHQAIATIDYTNPFPSLLGMPSPKGVPIVWALSYMEQPSMRSQPNRLFGDACTVMLALRPTQVVEGNAELLASAAEPVLSAYFTIVRQDEFWKIYQRQNGCF